MADKETVAEGQKKDWIEWTGMIVGCTTGIVIFIV